MRLPDIINKCDSQTSIFLKIFKLSWWDYTDCKCCIFWRGVIMGAALTAFILVSILSWL